MTAKFNIYSGLLKAYEDSRGNRRFRTTASSTITDLAGDEIMPPAIEKMTAKAGDNLTIFLNHEYRVPEDVLGSVENATMATRGVDGNGNPIIDLDFDIRLNDTNPRALQTYEAIKSGVKLGTSIGAIVRHAEKKKGGGLKIDDIDLLEASIVGIPANPRSWVQYAVKAINRDPSVLIAGISNAIPEDDLDDPVIDDEKLAAMCPTCGKSKSNGGDCPDSYHKDVTPDLVKKPLSGHERHDLPDSAFACPEKRLYPHHTASGAVDKPHLRAALSRVGDPSNDQCGKAHLEAHARALGMGDRKPDGKSLDEETFVEALTNDFDREHFLLKADGNDFSHDHEHAHTHEHEHDHGDEMTHSHEHTHLHGHEHDHGGENDHDHDEEMNHSAHDHNHDNTDDEHPHGSNDDGDEPDNDDDDESDDRRKQAARTRVTVTVDSEDRPAQGTPKEPELAVTDEDRADVPTDEATAALGDITRGMTIDPTELASIVKNFKELGDKYVALQKKYDEEHDRRVDAEENLAAAFQVFDRIADLPLGRKTGFAKAVGEFRTRFPQYDEEFLKFMEK